MKKIKIEDTIYEVDTDFRVAIECDRIARDKTINDTERSLAILYILFKNIENPEHYEKMMNWAINYLTFGKERTTSKEPDMDLTKDKGLIASSFKYDYNYNPYNMDYLSWEEFYTDLENLTSNVELGNCCALNRARYWRNYDISKVEDPKEKADIMKIKQYYALDKEEPEIILTEEQQKSVDEFYKALGY